MTIPTLTTKSILFSLLFFALVVTCFAADGELDPTFGSGGLVFTPSGQPYELVVDIAIQGDGKLIAIGRSEISPQNTWRTVVVRYNLDGTLDTSFGTAGKLFLPGIFPSKIMALADGKIVAAGAVGTAFQDSRAYIARFNSDGTVDTTFNGTGTVSLDVGYTATGIQVQLDGKLVATAPSTIVRFLTDGTLDSTFGNGGIVDASFGSSNLKIQPDGKFVGASTIFEGTLTVFSVFRYNADGSPDTTFGTGGRVLTRFIEPGPGITDPFNRVSTLGLQADGKIVVAGVMGQANSFYTRSIAVARFDSNGSLDTTFGSGGKTTVPYSNAELTANDLAIQPDNKVVLAVRINFVPKVSHFAVLRLRADGVLDQTFNDDGWFVHTHSSFGGWGDGQAVALQADGKIVGGGYIKDPNVSQVKFTLARFDNPSCPANCGAPNRAVFDFDGDGKTDASVFREGMWFINPSTNSNSYYGHQWGVPTDKLVPADYDGDGKTDIAVYRPPVGNNWAYFYIFQSSTNTFRIDQDFSYPDWDPSIVGDWDGDGKDDSAVYIQGPPSGEPSTFRFRPSTQSQGFREIKWGIRGDEPLRGDFDGDGIMDAAVYRSSNNVWYIRQSSNGQLRVVYSGVASDKRVSGDFDGDGKTDIAIYRDGIWAVLQSSNNQGRYEYWGLGTDKLVPGDYDGDGRTDFAVWRDGDYWILDSATSQYTYRRFGLAGDIPVASVFLP